MRGLSRRFTILVALWWSTAAFTACVSSDAGLASMREAMLSRGSEHTIEPTTPGELSSVARERLGRPLEVEDAVAIALANNPRVQSSLAEVELARAELAGRLFENPDVHGELRFPVGHDGDHIAAEAGAMVSLADLWQVPLARSAGAAALDAAALEAARAALDLAHETRLAFFDYLAARERLALAQAALETASAAAEFAQRLYEAGGFTRLELGHEMMFYEEARLALAEAEGELAQRRAALDRLMGLAGGDQLAWEAAGTGLPALPDEAVAVPDDFETQALAQNLDLQIIEQRYAAAAAESDAAVAASIVPELRAGVSAELEEEGWGVGPALELALPLFDQGQGRRGVAQARLMRLEAEYAGAAAGVRTSARSAATALELAERRARFYAETVVPLQEDIVGLTLLHYNAMDIGIFELIEARRRELEVARANVGALRNYWVARTSLEAIGRGHLVTVPGAMDAGELDTPAMPTTGAGDPGGDH